MATKFSASMLDGSHLNDPDYGPASYSYMFAAQVSKDNLEFVWDPEKMPPLSIDEKEVDTAYHLSIHRAVLGAEAVEGELNLMELETKDMASNNISTPLVYLKAGSKYQSNLDLVLPGLYAKFKLAKGTGPMHLIGQITAVPHKNDEEGLSEEEAESETELEAGEEEDTVEEEDDAKVKEEKKESSSNNGNSDAAAIEVKKRKPDETGSIPQGAKKAKIVATEDVAKTVPNPPDTTEEKMEEAETVETK